MDTALAAASAFTGSRAWGMPEASGKLYRVSAVHSASAKRLDKYIAQAASRSCRPAACTMRRSSAENRSCAALRRAVSSAMTIPSSLVPFARLMASTSCRPEISL
ncbi:uncharacterized protein Tco025E_00110 [Trypanosoma conorhini]|uniref:Uncharacterized protein n=1 Tax=Trypanosoma conorhini TaxID=83891 RepID=A0A3R7N9M7_9TRYP|nr:uncharacterized protein Tco025E_00110 [Trypanosoma conorhini]RNF27726.1 hypothetical protein Tco025E_00110 [Trypanosoma conorhini]